MSDSFNMSDETALTLSSVASAAYGLHWLFATPHAHSMCMASTNPFDASTGRWFGFMLLFSAAQSLAVAKAPACKAAKKNVLKVAGLGWLAGVALGLWHVSQGTQRGDTAAPSVLLLGSVAGLCLWRGYAA